MAASGHPRHDGEGFLGTCVMGWFMLGVNRQGVFPWGFGLCLSGPVLAFRNGCWVFVFMDVRYMHAVESSLNAQVSAV